MDDRLLRGNGNYVILFLLALMASDRLRRCSTVHRGHRLAYGRGTLPGAISPAAHI